MQKVLHFIGLAIVSGIFFVMPISIVIIIFEKIFHIGKKVAILFNFHPSNHSFIKDFFFNLVVISLVVLFCFLAGLFARLGWVKQVIAFIEDKVLTLLPGYSFTKATAQDILGVKEHKFQKVILVSHANRFELGFLVETISADKVIVFIPDVPRPRSGKIFIVNAENVLDTDMSIHDAFVLMKNIGDGGAQVLKKYIS